MGGYNRGYIQSTGNVFQLDKRIGLAAQNHCRRGFIGVSDNIDDGYARRGSRIACSTGRGSVLRDGEHVVVYDGGKLRRSNAHRLAQ